MNARLEQWQDETRDFFRYRADLKRFFNDFQAKYRVFTAWVNESEIIILVEIRLHEPGTVEAFTFDCAGDCKYHFRTATSHTELKVHDTRLNAIMRAIYGEFERHRDEPEHELPFTGSVYFDTINRKKHRKGSAVNGP